MSLKEVTYTALDLQTIVNNDVLSLIIRDMVKYAESIRQSISRAALITGLAGFSGLMANNVYGQPPVVTSSWSSSVVYQGQTQAYAWSTANAASCEESLNPDATLHKNLRLWTINKAWIWALKVLKTDIYDIGLFNDRSPRGVFYPCERRDLRGYSKRIIHRIPVDTLGYDVGPCRLPWINNCR